MWHSLVCWFLSLVGHLKQLKQLCTYLIGWGLYSYLCWLGIVHKCVTKFSLVWFAPTPGLLQDDYGMTSGWDDFRRTSGWLHNDIMKTSQWLQDDFTMTSIWLHDDFTMTSLGLLLWGPPRIPPWSPPWSSPWSSPWSFPWCPPWSPLWSSPWSPPWSIQLALITTF